MAEFGILPGLTSQVAMQAEGSRTRLRTLLTERFSLPRPRQSSNSAISQITCDCRALQVFAYAAFLRDAADCCVSGYANLNNDGQSDMSFSLLFFMVFGLILPVVGIVWVLRARDT